MTYEEAVLLKPAIVGRRPEFLEGALKEAAEILQAEGEIDVILSSPDSEIEIWG